MIWRKKKKALLKFLVSAWMCVSESASPALCLSKLLGLFFLWTNSLNCVYLCSSFSCAETSSVHILFLLAFFYGAIHRVSPNPPPSPTAVLFSINPVGVTGHSCCSHHRQWAEGRDTEIKWWWECSLLFKGSNGVKILWGLVFFCFHSEFDCSGLLHLGFEVGCSLQKLNRLWWLLMEMKLLT